MANTTTKTLLVDGSRVHAVHLYLASDGATGDLSDYVAVDVSALTPAATHTRIRRIYGHLVGFTGLLEFDATTDDGFMTLPQDDPFDFDLRAYGGLRDYKSSGYTGDILLTTSGFTAAGDRGFLVIELEKLGT